jgi:putative addiction module CopG family antidote
MVLTMHIGLAPVDEKFIKESVKNGIFRSEAEAVRDAVRRAREREEDKQERLLNALRLGDADIAAGRVTPYTPELLNKIESEARSHTPPAENQTPMSSPKFTLELTDRAVLDFRDILSYTLQTWGDDQLIKYRDLITESFNSIAKTP